MIPIKKILCPTDFSEPSYLGLQVANELALQFASEIILVHVIPPAHQVPGPDMPGFNVTLYMQQLLIDSQKLLEGVVQDQFSSSVKVETFVLEGDPASQVVSLAASEKVGMIVIATHGWTGWRHFIFGSVSEKVIRHSKCPVLTVPNPERSD